MKKLSVFIVISLIAGYVLYQNWSIWLLKIISFRSGSTQNIFSTSGSSPTAPFKDGRYTGNPTDAYYGTVQVKTTIQSGKITDVQFLQYPGDRARSVAINTLAMPNLKQEAIQAQSAQVDIVSGATDSSQAFIQSLQSALDKAKN